MIHINVSKRHLAAVTDEPLVAKTVGVVDFEAAFDPEWEDYEKYIVFAMAGGKGVPVLYAGGTATVPAQALDKSGHLRISAVGLAEGRRDVTAMMMEPLYVNRNGDLGEDPPPAEQSPTLLQQAVLAAARSAAEAREAVEEAKKLLGGGTPEGPAKPGKDGGYYTPKVTQPSDDTMRIAFEPSDEDMPTVNPTEVKLPAGKTPEKGVDYFTQEDKQELVEDVLAEVDIPEDGRSPAITILENGNWAIDGVDTGKPSRGENGTGGGTGGDQLELINSLIVPDGAEEITSLSFNKDLAGNKFELKKARLCYFYPIYTGESGIPSFSFLEINGVTSGNESPYLYTSAFCQASLKVTHCGYIDIDVSGPLQFEETHRTNQPATAQSEYVWKFGDIRHYPIKSIGGTNMLIFEGCKFYLYGVRV